MADRMKGMSKEEEDALFAAAAKGPNQLELASRALDSFMKSSGSKERELGRRYGAAEANKVLVGEAREVISEAQSNIANSDAPSQLKDMATKANNDAQKEESFDTIFSIIQKLYGATYDEQHKGRRGGRKRRTRKTRKSRKTRRYARRR